MNNPINVAMIQTIEATWQSIQDLAQSQQEYVDEPTVEDLAEECISLQHATEDNQQRLLAYVANREKDDHQYDETADWVDRICNHPMPEWEPVYCTEHGCEIERWEPCHECVEETQQNDRFNDPRYEEQFYK